MMEVAANASRAAREDSADRDHEAPTKDPAVRRYDRRPTRPTPRWRWVRRETTRRVGRRVV